MLDLFDFYNHHRFFCLFVIKKTDICEFLSTVVEEEGSVENLRSIDWKCHNRPYFFPVGKSIFLGLASEKIVMEEI